MIRRLIILLLIVGCEETTAPIPTHGCLDSQATNYDATASIDNNTCTYIDSCGVIDIDKTNDCVKDCADEWGGDAVIDGCGVCGGEGSAFDANFETTWELYYGQFHPISWTSSENIEIYHLTDDEYILDINCANFSIIWDHNYTDIGDQPPWNFTGSWSPLETSPNYENLDVNFIEWNWLSFPQSYINYFGELPEFVGYNIISDSLKIYYKYDNNTFGIDTYILH